MGSTGTRISRTRCTTGRPPRAADRAFRAAEAAAGTGLAEMSARYALRALTAAGRIVQPRPGQWALPEACPFLPPPREQIVAFVAADGGGTYAEIRRSTRLEGARLSGYLAALVPRSRS